jgi:hypothetical protein
MKAGSIFLILYATLYSEAKFFNYEKHIVSDRSDTDYWMVAGIFCIQRIRAYTYPDRTGSNRIIVGIDPQGVIPYTN